MTTRFANADELDHAILGKPQRIRSKEDPVFAPYGQLAIAQDILLIRIMNGMTILYNVASSESTAITLQNMINSEYILNDGFRFWASEGNCVYSYIFRQDINPEAVSKVKQTHASYMSQLESLENSIRSDPNNENPIIVKLCFKQNWDRMFRPYETKA